MVTMTVRNIPDEVYRALQVQAAEHGHSADAEVRTILENAVKNKQRVKLGSMLIEMGQQIQLSDEEFAIMSQVRDKTLPRPVDLE